MKIQEYNFGKVTIGSEVYVSDLIILPDRIIPNWWRKSGHVLVPEDLDKVLEAAPDVLVVGTGGFDMLKVPESTRDFLQDKGIELHALRTQDACTLFNKLSAKKRAAAALHLTC